MTRSPSAGNGRETEGKTEITVSLKKADIVDAANDRNSSRAANLRSNISLMNIFELLKAGKIAA